VNFAVVSQFLRKFPCNFPVDRQTGWLWTGSTASHDYPFISGSYGFPSVTHGASVCYSLVGQFDPIPACRGMIARQTQSMITKLDIAPRLDQLARTSAKEPQRQEGHTFDQRIT
jgi:hypothetical protein